MANWSWTKLRKTETIMGEYTLKTRHRRESEILDVYLNFIRFTGENIYSDTQVVPNI